MVKLSKTMIVHYVISNGQFPPFLLTASHIIPAQIKHKYADQFYHDFSEITGQLQDDYKIIL